MSTELKFEIYSLLTKEGKGITGPMSPVLFAKEIGELTETKWNRLARISFNDQEIFQIYEGEPRSLTGHDTLLIGCRYRNDLALYLWVDKGIGGMPVATCFQSDREIVLSPIYKKDTEFARKLTADELYEIFDCVFKNPQVLDIRKQPNRIVKKPKRRRF